MRELVLMFRSGRVAQIWTMAGLALYWLVLMHLPITNYGGWGTDLPLNLLSWATVGGIITGCWLLTPVARIRTSYIFWLWLAGAVMMSLPVLWSPSVAARLNALPRIAGMWGGILLYLTILQLRCQIRMMQMTLMLLAGAGMVECIWILSELYLPLSWLPTTAQALVTHYGRYGVGSFQQANVTSSFLALSLGCMLILTGLSSATSSLCWLECVRRGTMAVGLVLTSTVLVLLKSRTGWLGGLSMVVIVILLFSSKRFRHEGCRRGWLILFPAIGFCIGLMLLNVSILEALHQHDGSNHQRWITLVQTVRMSKIHPILGDGAGTFQGAYQNFVAGLPGGNPGREMMNFPHNEIIYQYVEGGIPALIGVLLWIVAGGLLWRQCVSALQRGLLLCMAPVLLHTQLEYPLYYSVAHWLAIVLLAAMADRPVDEMSTAVTSVNMSSGVIGVLNISTIVGRYLFAAFGIYGMIMSLQSLITGQVLGRFENNALNNPEEITQLHIPWLMKQRAEHDRALLWLIRYRELPDIDYLTRFINENKIWLSINADDAMYRNQIEVLHYLHRDEEARLLQRKAQLMFSWEAGTF